MSLYISLVNEIAAGLTDRNQVSQIADRIFDAYHLNQNHPDLAKLKLLLRTEVAKSFEIDIFATRLSYAENLADSPGLLIYEEMHKLFWLCREIYLLSWIGVAASLSRDSPFGDAVRGRIEKQPKMSALVAEDHLAALSQTDDMWWVTYARSPH